MTLATNATGDVIETGTNTHTGRVFVKNRATNQRVDFAPEMAIAVAIAMSEHVTNDDDRPLNLAGWALIAAVTAAIAVLGLATLTAWATREEQ